MIVVIRSYWQYYTSPIKSMAGFAISGLKWNESIDRRAGQSVPGSSMAGNWSRFGLCDIVTRASASSEAQGQLVGAGKSLNGRKKFRRTKVKNTFLRLNFFPAHSNCPWVSEDGASVAFVVSTDPDVLVHFECCISADSKVQASIERETEVKPIQACRVHSGALDELASQRLTGKFSLFFFKLGHIALTFLSVIRLVEVQYSVVIKTVNEHLRLSSSPSVPSIFFYLFIYFTNRNKTYNIYLLLHTILTLLTLLTLVTILEVLTILAILLSLTPK